MRAVKDGLPALYGEGEESEVFLLDGRSWTCPSYPAEEVEIKVLSPMTYLLFFAHHGSLA